MGVDVHSQILSGEEFLKGMMGLVEPLSEEVIQNQQNQRWVALQKRMDIS